MNKLFVGSVIVVLIVALGYVILGNQEEVEKKSIRSTSYKDATYFIDGSFVTLNNGEAEEVVAPDSASKIITRYYGNEATGDLNGDGVPDTAFLLTQETGGNGTFYYVAVALKANGGYLETNTIFLGDRIAPMPTEIKNG